MYKRILVTGIPGHVSDVIMGYSGLLPLVSSTFPRIRTKAEFLKNAADLSNSGNQLIGEAALSCLPRDRTTFMPFWHLYNAREDPDFLRQLKENYDVCVLVTSNLIRVDYHAAAEADVLERIELPLVVLGIGIQREADLESELPDGIMRLVRLLVDRDSFVCARGYPTANFLVKHGVKNARAGGCPSMFHYASNVTRAWSAAKDFRLTRQSSVLFSGYLGEEPASATITDMNRLVGPGGRCKYILQDEMFRSELSIGGNDQDDVYDAATGRITSPVTFPYQESMEAAVDAHYFFDAQQWRAWSSQASFALGRRFHGSLIALQAGVPSLMISIDDRMQEMIDFIGYPFLNDDEWTRCEHKSDYLNAFLAEIDAGSVIDRYREREANFQAYLKDSGLAP